MPRLMAAAPNLTHTLLCVPICLESMHRAVGKQHPRFVEKLHARAILALHPVCRRLTWEHDGQAIQNVLGPAAAYELMDGAR